MIIATSPAVRGARGGIAFTIASTFGRMTSGASASASLREAQMAIRKSKRWQSPYYWAGFVIEGDWRGLI